MIELDLQRVSWCVMSHMKTLAAVRCLCVANQIEAGWCADSEREAAKLLRDLRRVMGVKGNVLVVRPKG